MTGVLTLWISALTIAAIGAWVFFDASLGLKEPQGCARLQSRRRWR
jgi:hypothetical protein